MLKKIFFSSQASFLVSILSLIITIITAKYLGAYGRGYLSIIIFYISISQLINEIFGVGTFMYLIQKYSVKEIISVSYLWFVISAIFCTIIVSYFHLIEKDLQIIFLISSVLVSINSLNLKVILNKRSISWYNISLILQPFVLLILLFLKGFNSFTIKDYLTFQIFSQLILTFFSILILRNEIFHKKLIFKDLKGLIKQSFNLGFINQSANLSQILNYRLSFFYLEKFDGLKAVGIFSIVLSIANVIWLFAISAGTLLGNEISKSSILNKIKINQFLNYLKISLAFTFLAISFIYFIPEHIFINILNNDFVEIKPLILMMFPALLIFTIAKIFAFLFSSLGEMKVNLYSSLFGLLPSIFLGYIFIKEYKLDGAIFSTTISFLMSSGVMLIYFYRLNRKYSKVT